MDRFGDHFVRFGQHPDPPPSAASPGCPGQVLGGRPESTREASIWGWFPVLFATILVVCLQNVGKIYILWPQMAPRRPPGGSQEAPKMHPRRHPGGLLVAHAHEAIAIISLLPISPRFLTENASSETQRWFPRPACFNFQLFSQGKTAKTPIGVSRG